MRIANCFLNVSFLLFFYFVQGMNGRPKIFTCGSEYYLPIPKNEINHLSSTTHQTSGNSDADQLSAERLNIYLKTNDDPNNEESSRLDELLIPNNLAAVVAAADTAVDVAATAAPPVIEETLLAQEEEEAKSFHVEECQTFKFEKCKEERWKEKLKMILPHVALILLSVIYTVIGAAIFYGIERPNEDRLKKFSLEQIWNFKRKFYLDIRNHFLNDNITVVDYSNMNSNISDIDRRGRNSEFDHILFNYSNRSTWGHFDTHFWSTVLTNETSRNKNDEFLKFYLDRRLNDFVTILHKAFKENYVTLDDIRKNETDTMWTFTSSIFFSATVITAIGYGHLVPQTTAGRVMCLIFCLIGIPLILVTIADIGRFLSIYVVLFYQHYTKFLNILSAFFAATANRFSRWRRRRRYRRSTVGALRQTSSITYDAANALINILAQRRGGAYDLDDEAEEAGTKCSLHRAGRKVETLVSSGADDRAEAAGHPMDENLMDNDDTEATNLENEDLSMDPINKQVSVAFILIILLGYTLFGAMLLQLWENWTLFEAFYYCVITVLTIGFGDYIPQNEKFMIITLFYIIGGLVVTTMCIDLVGSQYIKKIHYFGRNVKNITQQAFLHLGGAGRKVKFGDVLGYVAYLQRSFGYTAEQLEQLKKLPEDYLIDCLIHGREPDLNYMGPKPYIPSEIIAIKWIEQPRTLSFVSEKVMASVESLDVTSRCSAAKTPREWYYHMILEHMKDAKV